MTMHNTEQTIRDELVLANHILARASVLDAFGHVSVRHPAHADHFLMAMSKAPELVQAEDILTYDSDAQALDADGRAQYIERFIHSEIYRARPDVVAICHHHSPSIMPFCIAGVTLVPVYQHGAMAGHHVPTWDSQHAFGDTNMLVTNALQGASLADALGDATMVLMRHHGATVVGIGLRELVFRAVVSCKNAEFQYRAMALGPVRGLTAGETQQAAQVPPAAIDRAWALWAREG